MATSEEQEAFEFDSARFNRSLMKLPEPDPRAKNALIATPSQSQDERARAIVEYQLNQLNLAKLQAGTGQAQQNLAALRALQNDQRNFFPAQCSAIGYCYPTGMAALGGDTFGLGTFGRILGLGK